jgi:hypothetical protein
MAEFKISRLRYTWKGTWTTATAYNRDDVVRYGGQTWVCFRQHTSSAFQTDQEFLANPADSEFTPAWRKMTDGVSWRGAWQTSTLYNPGDIVLYGGVLYLTIESNTSGATFSEYADKFAVYADAYKWSNTWTQNTRYGVGEVVRYNGIVYRCIVEHTSGTSNEGTEIGNNDGNQDSTLENWEIVHEGIEYVGTWAAATRYRKNDLVKYGGSVLRCTIGHVSTDHISNGNFITEFPGLNFYDTWSDGTDYAIGDVVRHGGYIYIANYNHNNVVPSLSQNPASLADQAWKLLSKASRLRGDYTYDTLYETGDLVRRGGNLYLALLDNAITDDGSTLDYLDDSNWEVVIPSANWRNSWAVGEIYSVGDIAVYRGSAWKCNIEHTSAIENFPGDNGEGFVYWDLVSEAGDNVALSTLGDLLTYGLSRALVGDGSTIGTTSLPVGAAGEVVAVDATNNVEYKRYGEVNKFIWVDKNTGTDDRTASRGTDPEKPYKTVRYALDRILDLEEYANITLYVGTGVYEEILPLRIPANVCVLGTELRSTTIKASAPVASLANDLPNLTLALSKFDSIITNVMRQIAVTPVAGNTVPQVLDAVVATESYEPPQFDEFGNEVLIPPAISSSAPSTVIDLIGDIGQYLQYYISGVGDDVTVASTNTANDGTDNELLNSRTILEANREFLIADVLAFMDVAGASYQRAYLEDMLNRFIDGFKKDLRFSGNYYTLIEARYYRNLILGSQNDDMFYCRDATGVRNLTTKGLTGTLNPQNVFELYRRPTGGSYVSLDPGWGPSDSTVWITTRSPYIQNVTTFGDNCVGQKIDGSLHLGGNKSIVSNDFTQVCSDGIGAWVLNNGRAELVSVFTYYAQIGMFAEKGGVIRATNGNSSYGDFGAVADGNDPTETPKFAEVNNRTEQAQVATAFAGEVNDEILSLEYLHCGQNYSAANFSFSGAGVNANAIFEETRDGGVFQALVKNAPGDAGGTPGAGGYSNIGNNAQFGDETSLTLATNSDFEEAEVLGLRLIITSGKGAGQYGYITAYNKINQKAQVSKESDNTPGWDHIIPGFPAQPSLFTDNTYRIEPRPIFSHPGFTASTVNIGSTSPWGNVVYGETELEFSSVAGTGGGDNVADDATFDIVKTARTYTATLVTPGAGYTIGETITISGDNLGGVTPDNDLLITVEDVSEDSTNTLVDFSTQGIAASGNFVVTPKSGNDSSYSKDGETWTTNQLPDTGDWTPLAAGGNRFVALKVNSADAISSKDGINWTQRSLGISSTWTDIAYGKSLNGSGSNGNSVFLAISQVGDIAVYSTDGGETWSQTTLPDIGDSSFNIWRAVAYGKGKFVAVADTGNFAAVGEYNAALDTWTWEPHIMDVIDDSSTKEWRTIAYGNNRWLAISGTGDISYSYNAIDWYPGTMPTQDGSTAHSWRKVAYGQGLFFAVGDTEQRAIAGDTPGDATTTFAATSEDGVTWTTRTLPSEKEWITVGFGNPDISPGDSTTFSNSTGTWVAVPYNDEDGAKILTGCRTKGRIIVDTGNISEIRIWEPGSGYENNLPSLTINDPNNTSDAYAEIRTADRVLAQPGWINRGVGYRTSSTVVTILGDGFADIIPEGQNVIVSGISGPIPGPGTQLRFRGASEFYTTQADTLISEDADGTKTIQFRITPRLTLDDFLEHTSQVEIRERYSQVRITGHDFLDVGTGNFEETNYPTLYTAATFVYAPENEVNEANGGRVFYTSTDQNGNFRCGELFAVEQATGIVTISADFFDFGGLTELALGGVRLGGSGAVVREFSTDPLFTQDSNNVVPTQRAIKSYLQNRLNVGGSDLLTASFIAGTVKVGPNEINNVAGLEVLFLKRADFSGAGAEISGSIMAQTMFFRSFDL